MVSLAVGVAPVRNDKLFGVVAVKVPLVEETCAKDTVGITKANATYNFFISWFFVKQIYLAGELNSILFIKKWYINKMPLVGFLTVNVCIWGKIPRLLGEDFSIIFID